MLRRNALGSVNGVNGWTHRGSLWQSVAVTVAAPSGPAVLAFSDPVLSDVGHFAPNSANLGNYIVTSTPLKWVELKRGGNVFRLLASHCKLSISAFLRF
jgi:hypothetical protein